MTSHLWILNNLIFPKGAEPTPDPLNSLLHYTVSTCHPKMNRRFKHRLSKCYFESLKKVKEFRFDSEIHLDTNQSKMVNDLALITGFVSQTKVNPQLIESSIPNIQLLCDNLPHDNEPFQLYTSQTCMDFHKLLVELLKKFQICLDDLDNDRGTFINNVKATLVFGHALWKIVRGSAFEMHLQNIANLLDKVREEEPRVVHDEVLDEELLPILSLRTDGQPMPLWKTYRDWMRLMVVQFDAAMILTKYAFKRSDRNISVKILVTPRVDRAFLPWRDLLGDSSLFPVADPSADPKSNEEILQFLNEASDSVKTANENVERGQIIQKGWRKRRNITK
jgi:hypothetical protein